MISPGGEGKIKITVDTRKQSAKLTKYISIESNDPRKRRERLIFQVSVKPWFKITPSSIVNLTGKFGETKSMDLIISAEVDEPLEIKPRKFSMKGKVSFALEEVEKGKQYKITFKNNPDVIGDFPGYLTLATNYSKKPVIVIRIHSRFYR